MYGAVTLGGHSTGRNEISTEHKATSRIFFWQSVLFSSLIVAAVISTQFSSIERASFEKQQLSTQPAVIESFASKDPFEFSCSNSYTASAPDIGKNYLWLHSRHLMEPYRQTTLTVKNGTEAGIYKWEIKPPNGSHSSTHVVYGAVVAYTCTYPGEYNITVTEAKMHDGKRIIARRGGGVSQCRYVRRELRTLSEEDRKKFFNAMGTVYWEDCETGVEKYGKRFTCMETIVDVHNTLAGARYCDHMHDGYGFMTQHAALSRWFESILQVISPSIALPYWDYTIEGQSFTLSNDIAVFRKSTIFNQDWFGSAEDSYAVKDGRFAYLPVKWNAKLDSSSKQKTLTNAYGFLRAPWNQNSVPYLTRFNLSYGFSFTAVPDCESHHRVLSYTEWNQFGQEIMYNPHGPIHLLVGGVGNVDWNNALKAMNYDLETAMYWVPSAFSRQKNMYRKGILECPDICSIDTPMEDCKCTCSHRNASEWSNKTKKELLESEPLSLLFPDGHTQEWLYNKAGDFVGREILQLLCNQEDKAAPIMGDSLESASPFDPIFWPIHPTVERLFIWRMMNGFDDELWPEDAAWSVKGFKTGYCWGHNQMDVLSWPNYLYEETGPGGPYTNFDIWTILDPRNKYSPYIYDNFEWVHCEQYGYNRTLL